MGTRLYGWGEREGGKEKGRVGEREREKGRECMVRGCSVIWRVRKKKWKLRPRERDLLGRPRALGGVFCVSF